MPFVFYTCVVVLGVLSMGFQLLASRILNPHFGSSILVWAWLISTFLAAFSLGSMLGGVVSKCEARARLRWQLGAAAFGVGALALTAFWWRPLMNLVETTFLESPMLGICVACLGLFFAPVTVLSSFGPQCVQFLATRGMLPGTASGLVYGVSTIGNIGGVMLTAFVLIPNFPVSTLLYGWLGVAVASLSLLILLLQSAPSPARLSQ